MTAPVIQFAPGGGGLHVDLERLVSSRLLVQGSSGAGKSYLVRYLLEQTHGRIQQFVFDPEGEFSTLRERFDYVVASAGGDGDVPAHPSSADMLCRQLVELEASAILDIYELDPEEREEFVGRFLHRLVNMPKEAWRSALVVVDEAHEFAPERGDPPSRKPMELIVSKGRKRGLCAIYSTQRLSKLSKNAGDLQNLLVGYTGLDVDVRRAGDILGFDKAQSQELKQLEHEFFAFGPAFSREVICVRSGPVQTHHPKPGEIRAPTPPPRGKLAALVAELSAIPERAAEEERNLEELQERVHELEAELRAARAGEEYEDRAYEIVEERDRYVSAAVAEQRRRFTELVQPMVDSARALHAALNGRLDAFVTAIDELEEGLANDDDDEDLIDAGDRVRPAAPRGTPPLPRPAPPPRPAPARFEAAGHAAGELEPRHLKILDALARLEAMGIDSPSRSVLAAVASYSPKSSGFEKAVSRLSALDLVHYPSAGDVALTELGRAAATPPETAVTLRELHASWFRILEPRHVRILEPLMKCYPRALSREELAQRSEYSAASSGYEKAISRLNSFGLVTYPQPGHVAATELLFPRGLR